MCIALTFQMMLDDYASVKSKHELDEQALLTYQNLEYVNEKERMFAAEHALHVMEIQGKSMESLT
jgi:hypothetical protein